MQKCFTVWQEIMQVLFRFPPEHKAWLHFLAFLSVRCCQRRGPADMSRRYVWSRKVVLTKTCAFTIISFSFSQLHGEFSEDSEQNSKTRWAGLGLLNELISSSMTRHMSPALGHDQYVNIILNHWDFEFLFQLIFLHSTLINVHFLPSSPPFKVIKLVIFFLL